MVILYFVRRLYLPTSRSLKRLEGVSKYLLVITFCSIGFFDNCSNCVARSPIVGHLSASLESLPTIRANKVQQILQDEFDKQLDVFNSVYYMYMTTSNAFGFFMDFLSVIYIVTITLTFLTIDTGKV